MIKKAFLLVSAGMSCLLSSCGSGGATLTTGDVNGIWMPDGSRVDANLGGGVTVEQNTGSYVRTLAASGTETVPQSVAWVVESQDRGVLYVEGQAKSCSILWEQTDASFTLTLVTDDRSLGLVFTDGHLASGDSATATARWSLYGKDGRKTAMGDAATLTRERRTASAG